MNLFYIYLGLETRHGRIIRKQEERGHRGDLVQVKQKLQLSVGLAFPTEGLEMQDLTPTSILASKSLHTFSYNSDHNHVFNYFSEKNDLYSLLRGKVETF